MKRSMTLGWLLAGGLVSAATINSNVVDFDFTTNGGAGAANPLVGNLNATFNQFDPSLGTLTGVTIMGGVNLILIGEASLGPVGQNGNSILGNFLLNGFYTLPGGLANEFDSDVGSAGCTAVGSDEFASCTQTEEFTMPQSVIPNVNSPVLTSYIGTSTVPLQLQSIGTVTLTSSSPPLTNFGNNLFFQSTEFKGDLLLQYTYDPAGVPEPGSTALLGGGLMLLGLVRYRRAFQTRTVAPARKPRSA